MNENAKKWVAALRSGKYKQAYGKLSDGEAFCCLGVACDLFKDECCLTTRNMNADKQVGFYDGPREYENYLPPIVQNLLGLKSCIGAFSHSALTHLNDMGCHFKDIADIIESEPKGLFTEEQPCCEICNETMSGQCLSVCERCTDNDSMIG